MTKTYSGSLLALTLLLPCIAPAQTVTYHGGPIVGSPRILPVYWGNTPNSAGITEFYKAVQTRLGWLDWDYHVGSTRIYDASTLSPVTITPTHGTSTVVKWNDIRDQLSDLIATGVVPPQDAGLIYAFHFPPTVNVYLFDDRRMCDVVGATHGSFSPWPGPGTQFPWITVVPTCGNFDSVTSLAYHELVEEMTNPETGGAQGYVNAWYEASNGQEIADICQSQTALLVGPPPPPPPYGPAILPGPYVAARAWSNAAGCVAAEPQLDDPVGVHVMAGRSTIVRFMAGGNCIPNNACSASWSGDTGQFSVSFSPQGSLGANNGTVTIGASLSASVGLHSIGFEVYNSAIGRFMQGFSYVTVDACVPTTCGNRCGTVSNGCGGTLNCAPCPPPPDPGCVHPPGTQCP